MSALHWILRVAVAAEFIGHGAFGIKTKEAWVAYYDVFGIPESWAYTLMPLTGSVDIALGLIVLFVPMRAVLLYMAVWGFFTASLRPLAGESPWELVERAYNFGIPAALLYLHGPATTLRGWFEPIREMPALTRARAARLTLGLRGIIAAYLVGHGALGLSGAKADHFASIGLAEAAGRYAGGFEVVLGLAVLAVPVAPLLLLVAAWKLGTESLYVTAGAYGAGWEVVERGSAYAAPLALLVATRHLHVPRARAGAVLAAVLFVAGCGGSDEPPAAKPAPLELRMATPDRAEMPGGKAVARFAAEVERRSGGGIRIAPVYEAAGEVRSFDQAVAGQVRGGEADLALVSARAWENAPRLRALETPFLIGDTAVLAQVATGELAARMLEGLEAEGVRGLALVPEGLRHPFGFGRAMVRPADFRGATVRAPRSEIGFALLRALGARPVDVAGGEFTEAVQAGRIAAAESSLELAEATLPRHATATGNVTFFPKVTVLAVNARRHDTLTRRQRDVLAAAAAATAEQVARELPAERESARAYCAQGGRVVEASESDLEALRKAAAPVRAKLEADRETRELIAAIGELAGGGSRERVACAPDGKPAVSGDDALPDGTYRNRLTVQEMVAAGVDRSSARDNAGVHTIRVKGNEIRDTLDPESGDAGTPCEATYAISGRTLEFAWKPDTPCSGDFTARWELRGRTLRLTGVDTPDPVDRALWGLEPFRRVR